MDVFRKEYKQTSEEQKSWINSFKEIAQNLHNDFDTCLDAIPESDKRMIALAKTNLEQAIMWAIKAIT